MSEISKALLDVQRAGLTVSKDSKNPHFKNRYVSLEALLETVVPLLNERGLLLTQPVLAIAPMGMLGVQTRIEHVETGESAESTMPLTELQKNDPQGQGSAITYGRRYTLMSLLGLVGEDDDDGNAASSKTSTAKKPARVKSRTTKTNDADSY